MGFIPTIEAPTAAPVIQFSEMGVSITRSSPYLSTRPLHVLPTYHGLLTPCPIINTELSDESKKSRVLFIVSLYDI